jgi:hypothetical protein
MDEDKIRKMKVELKRIKKTFYGVTKLTIRRVKDCIRTLFGYFLYFYYLQLIKKLTKMHFE